MAQDVGAIVNGLGITAESLAGDELVSDAMVLMKVIQADGSVTLLVAHSDAMSWIEKLGMLHVAVGLEQQRGYRDADDD